MFNDFGWKTRKYAGRHPWRMCLLTFGRLMGPRRGMRYRLKNNNWAARWHASSTRRLTTYKQTDPKVNISQKLPRRSIFPLYFRQRVLSASPDTVINQPPPFVLTGIRHPLTTFWTAPGGGNPGPGAVSTSCRIPGPAARQIALGRTTVYSSGYTEEEQ